MQISEHYSSYPRKTLIVVSNNELAKLFVAQGREVEELDILQMELSKPEGRPSAMQNAGAPEDDELKRQNRLALYKELSERLLVALKGDIEEIILCAPEAQKTDLTDHMHTDVMKHVKAVVPKNLASLPLDQVIRILQETP